MLIISPAPPPLALWCERMRSGEGALVSLEAAVRGSALKFQHGSGCGHCFLPRLGMVAARVRSGLTSPPPPGSMCPPPPLLLQQLREGSTCR